MSLFLEGEDVIDLLLRVYNRIVYHVSTFHLYFYLYSHSHKNAQSQRFDSLHSFLVSFNLISVLTLSNALACYSQVRTVVYIVCVSCIFLFMSIITHSLFQTLSRVTLSLSQLSYNSIAFTHHTPSSLVVRTSIVVLRDSQSLTKYIFE